MQNVSMPFIMILSSYKEGNLEVYLYSKIDVSRYSYSKTIRLFWESQEEYSICPDLIEDYDRAYTLRISIDSLVSDQTCCKSKEIWECQVWGMFKG